MKLLKIDLGCDTNVKKGFTGVDRYGRGATIVDDIVTLETIKDNTVDEANASHVLEHLANDDVPKAMKNVLRVLKPGCKWTIEVPDLIWVLQDFLNTPEPKRWGWKLQTVFGLQSRPGEFHFTGFSPERLGHLLVATGFVNVKVKNAFSKRHNQQVIRASAFKPK